MEKQKTARASPFGGMGRKWVAMTPVHVGVVRSISDVACQKRKRQERNLRAAKCACKVLQSDFILWVTKVGLVSDPGNSFRNPMSNILRFRCKTF